MILVFTVAELIKAYNLVRFIWQVKLYERSNELYPPQRQPIQKYNIVIIKIMYSFYNVILSLKGPY